MPIRMMGLFHWWHQQRLHIQLALLGCLIIAATLIFDAFVTAQRQSNLAYQRMQDDALALTKNIAVTGAYQIVNNDLAALEELLLKSAEFPGVLTIQIIDPRGAPLGMVRNQPGGYPTVVYAVEHVTLPQWLTAVTEPRVVVYKEYMEIWQPVRTSTILGWLRMEYDLRGLANIRKSIWQDNLVTSISAIAIDFFILLMILRLPMRGLKQAGEFALNLCKMDGKTLQVPPSSHEVNTLTGALNQASKTLYRQHKTIQQTNRHLTQTADELTAAKATLEQKVQERTEQLSWRATHDSLTELYNRHEFETRLQETLNHSLVDEGEHFICYIDLDQFKVVNDTCGHAAGDELLRQVSQRLSGIIRKSDILARLGGDEFGIILIDCPKSHANRITRNILGSLREQRFIWQNHSFNIGASIGMVPISVETPDIATLLSAADIACYAAKDAGRDQIKLFSLDDAEQVQRQSEMRWAGRTTKAIEENRLSLFLQPIIPLHPNTSTRYHYEILIRMYSEKGELISPEAFLPAAERYGLITEIDRWVIDTAFHELRRLFSPNSDEQLVISINLSGPSLGNCDMSEYIITKLHEHQIPPGAVCFEITETAAITRLSEAITMIKALKAEGCRFALDDFGTGLASFSYLKSLPVDYLKIDGSFVRDILDDTMDLTIVESVNNLGHALSLETIAESVENEAVARKLKRIGVDYVQGYYIGDPSPLTESDIFTRPHVQKAKVCGPDAG